MPSLADLITEGEFAKGLDRPSGNPFGRWAQGVAQRTMHPLETLAGAAQKAMDDPTATALDWSNPIGGSLSSLVGMFAGKGAKTANLVSLDLAQKLKQQGVPDEAIWKQTGWTLDTPDKMPRFEIPDNTSELNLFDIQGQKKSFLDIGKSVSHDDLFNAYPEVKDYSASITQSPELRQVGSFVNPERNIHPVIEASGADAKSTTLHELQHAIQQREGFASGGSPSQFMESLSNQRANFDDNINFINQELSKSVGTPRYDELLNMRQSLVDKMRNYGLDDAIGMRETAHNQYKRLAGESEARLTQARMNMTPEERLANYPYQPEYFQQATGVPLKDLIVRTK